MAKIEALPPRAMVFVDGGNFYHRLKDAFGRADISYNKLIKWLGLDREILQLFFYVGEPTGEDQASKALRQKFEQFVDYLRRTPLVTIRLGYTQRTETGEWEEKAVDTLLASDLVTKAVRDEYDEAILISADGDLVPNVLEVRQLGKKVYLAQFAIAPAYRLRRAVDGIIELDCPEVRACLRGPALK